MNKPQLKITISLSAFHRFRLRELASPEGGDWYTPTYNPNHNVVECIHYFTLSRKSYLLFSIQVPLCQLMGTHHQLLVFVFALVCRGFQINTPICHCIITLPNSPSYRKTYQFTQKKRFNIIGENPWTISINVIQSICRLICGVISGRRRSGMNFEMGLTKCDWLKSISRLPIAEQNTCIHMYENSSSYWSQ